MSPLRQSARLRPYYAPKTRSTMLKQQIASMRGDDYSSAARRGGSSSSSARPDQDEVRKSPKAAESKKRKSGGKGSDPSKAAAQAKAGGGRRRDSSGQYIKIGKDDETLNGSKTSASAPREGGATASGCDDERLGRIRARCFTLLHRLSRAITFAEVWSADMKRSQRRGLDASVFPVVEMAKAEDAIPETKIQIRLLLKEYDQCLTDAAAALQLPSAEEEKTPRRSNRSSKSSSSPKQVLFSPCSARQAWSMA